MERVIGVDLGTTNSCVAIVDAGVPVVIPNRGGYRTTPSMVAVVESGRRLVGHIAKRQAITNAEHTAFAIKRLIGRQFAAPEVAATRTVAPFSLIEGPHGDVRVQLRDTLYSTSELSAFVLQEMKSVAEEYLGHEVKKAVVTVPSYFNDGQRQATRDAGRIAGLDVIRIINEPTAAALSFGFGRDVERRIAVFDLGGGTFDISVLEIGHGVFHVLSTSGDTFLGGEDFDRRIMEWLLAQFEHQTGISVRQDRMAMQRLKDAAERAKCELSGVKETEISLPFLITNARNEPLHLQQTVTRAKLEELTADLVDRTIGICRRVFADAHVEPRSIEDVILVGGQTRMPRVQQTVAKFFDRAPCKGVHPDEVVALGAAIQGAALVDERSDMLLLDVTPQTLGVMVAGGRFHHLIERNTTIPTSRSHRYTTIKDNQTSVKVLAMQGESDRAQENTVLGEFMLTGLRPARKGEVEVEISFDISADGIVSVSARDVETSQQQSITVHSRTDLTEDEILRMTQANRESQIEARNELQFDRLRQPTERSIKEIEQLFPMVESVLLDTDFGQDALQRARSLIARTQKAISARDTNGMVSIRDDLNRTLHMFKGIAERTPRPQT